MAIIGFVLLVAAAVVGVDVVAQNNFSIDIDAFNQVFTTSASVVMAAGVVTGLAAALGLMLVRDGVVRRRRIRLEAKAVEEDRERHIAELEEEHEARRRADVGAHNGETVDVRDSDRVTSF